MIQKIKSSYEHTIYASYLGYITQAIVNNFAPLLFLTFASIFGLSLAQITMITTINFMTQLIVDLICAKVIDRVGYRRAIVVAHITAAAGLIGMSVFPYWLGDAYVGLIIAVILYAIGGGIIEVLISPIVEACPTKKKEAAMSLLHSFYCWGHVGVVLAATAFFAVFGIENWRILAWVLALVPICNVFYFLLVPIFPIVDEHHKLAFGALLKQKSFWLLIVMMVCAGASEQAMSQWASAFAEAGLQVSKTVGDLLGPCAFAVCMGATRAYYGKNSDKVPLKSAMVISAIACIICYVVAVFGGHPVLCLIGCAFCGFTVGMFWPGTFSIAALELPGGGTAMYALMALAGDLGCSSGPTVVGMVADRAGGNLKAGILAAIIFPIVMLCSLCFVKQKKN